MTPPTGSPQKPATSKQERVYQSVHQRILSGAYSPGYRLVIDSLAEELGVSALPVREAIRRLEAEGLVVYQPNAGPRVAPADPAQFVDSMTVLAVLEGYATALAAPHVTADDIRRLREINDAMLACINTLDALRFGELNQEFHMAIYERCPNPYLVEMLRETGRRLDVIRRTVFTRIPYRGTDSTEEHVGLIELIESGAPSEELEAAARAHKLRTVTTFREHQLGEPAPGAG
jgi:DNA-binding GntR family transcriptional regulator